MYELLPAILAASLLGIEPVMWGWHHLRRKRWP